MLRTDATSCPTASSDDALMVLSRGEETLVRDGYEEDSRQFGSAAYIGG